jgi:uncharacterized protein YabN with tetrapyrrole methylase and pyrophosphatase domain
LSFVEPALTALGLDGLNGLQLFDAIAIAGYNHPPVSPDAPLLLGQVYNRLLAGELKLALMAIYPDEHPTVLVHAAGTQAELLERLPLYEIDRSELIDHLTSLYVPPLPLPASLDALAEAVAVLRGPGGCPWDQEQTPQSLRAGFLEEAAELLDALDTRTWTTCARNWATSAPYCDADTNGARGGAVPPQRCHCRNPRQDQAAPSSCLGRLAGRAQRGGGRQLGGDQGA